MKRNGFVNLDGERWRAVCGEHVVVILALNNHERTQATLQRVRESGYRDTVVLVDNGSTPPMEEIAQRFACAYFRYAENRYVNPIWNVALQCVQAETVTLLNNDCLVADGYLQETPALFQSLGLSLLAPTSVPIDDILSLHHETRNVLAPSGDLSITDCGAIREGHCMSVLLRDYRRIGKEVPARYLIWYGDDWIWGQLRLHGYGCARLTNRYCVRETSATLNRSQALRNRALEERAAAKRDRAMLRARLAAGKLQQSEYEHLCSRLGYRGALRTFRKQLGSIKRSLLRSGQRLQKARTLIENEMQCES